MQASYHIAMPRTFPGFSPKALSFFRQLEKNNKREWFQPRKDQFEELVRKPMLGSSPAVRNSERK